MVLDAHVQEAEGICMLLERCPAATDHTQVLAVGTQINAQTISPCTANFIALPVF